MQNLGDVCHMCGKKVFVMERHMEDGVLHHRSCIRAKQRASTKAAQSHNPVIAKPWATPGKDQSTEENKWVRPAAKPYVPKVATTTDDKEKKVGNGDVKPWQRSASPRSDVVLGSVNTKPIVSDHQSSGNSVNDESTRKGLLSTMLGFAGRLNSGDNKENTTSNSHTNQLSTDRSISNQKTHDPSKGLNSTPSTNATSMTPAPSYNIGDKSGVLPTSKLGVNHVAARVVADHNAQKSNTNNLTPKVGRSQPSTVNNLVPKSVASQPTNVVTNSVVKPKVVANHNTTARVVANHNIPNKVVTNQNVKSRVVANHNTTARVVANHNTDSKVITNQNSQARVVANHNRARVVADHTKTSGHTGDGPVLTSKVDTSPVTTRIVSNHRTPRVVADHTKHLTERTQSPQRMDYTTTPQSTQKSATGIEINKLKKSPFENKLDNNKANAPPSKLMDTNISRSQSPKPFGRITSPRSDSPTRSNPTSQKTPAGSSKYGVQPLAQLMGSRSTRSAQQTTDDSPPLPATAPPSGKVTNTAIGNEKGLDSVRIQPEKPGRHKSPSRMQTSPENPGRHKSPSRMQASPENPGKHTSPSRMQTSPSHETRKALFPWQQSTGLCGCN